MADFLDGSSKGQESAPLTQAQTIAICRHLQSEIRDVGSLLAELRDDFSNTHEHVQALRAAAGSNDDVIHSLTTGRADADISISKLQSELERNNTSTQNVASEAVVNKGKIEKLEEAKLIIDTQLEFISKDLFQNREDNKRIQDDIAGRLDEDMRALRNNWESSSLSIAQAAEDQRKMTDAHKAERTSLRDAHLSIEGVLNEMKKSNTVASILENRLSSTAKGVQQNWMKLADLSETSVKLNECYEKTRARVVDAEAQIKLLSDSDKQTHLELEEATRQIERTTDRLAQALKLVEEEAITSEDMLQQLNSMRHSGEGQARHIAQLTKEIQDVSESTQQVRAGLKETSSLLLPNIHLDSPEAAQGHAARHGSLLVSNAGPVSSRFRPNATPRVGKFS